MDGQSGRGKCAVVTGASSGIGYELAKRAAKEGYDLVVAAENPGIHEAAGAFRALGVQVAPVQADLASMEGVETLVAELEGRSIECLMANAGRGLGRAFLDQDFGEIRNVIDTNVTGTLYLLHKLARQMRDAGHGRILITGSIAGLMPGTYQAVYNGSKAFLDSFAFALRHELKDSGVSVTVLMPGATETEFFERADMMDTKVGNARKDDPADVAETGFRAMMQGRGEVVSGWQNKLQAAIAHITPAGRLAEMHAGMAAPGTGK
jgi:short-subunit dehydrogenase